MEQIWLREMSRYFDARFEHLGERLDDLRHQIDTLQTTVEARLDAHEEYHRAGEHRWGLIKLAAMHPFKLAGAAVAAAALAQTLAPENLRAIERLAAAIFKWLGA